LVPHDWSRWSLLSDRARAAREPLSELSLRREESWKQRDYLT
jgi:hypothetical protein